MFYKVVCRDLLLIQGRNKLILLFFPSYPEHVSDIRFYQSLWFVLCSAPSILTHNIERKWGKIGRNSLALAKAKDKTKEKTKAKDKAKGKAKDKAKGKAKEKAKDKAKAKAKALALDLALSLVLSLALAKAKAKAKNKAKNNFVSPYILSI
uniref:Uncharacterized protein n=1 Tax=Acrobeloides nanus TaxID=290746 RepID=A0A914DF57_9BILA